MKNFLIRAGSAWCVLILLSLPSYGQVAIEWEETYGGDHEDRLRSIAVAADGGYLLGGDSDSDVGGDKSAELLGKTDFWIVKVDAQGNKEWDRAYGSEFIDYLFTVLALEDGGFLLAGRSFGDITDPLSGETNFRVIRIDAAGDKIWDRAYGSMRGDYLQQAIITDDGGFLLAGSSQGTGGDRAEEPRGESRDYWAIKIDADGNMEWERAIAGFGTDYHRAVAQGADGGYLLGGFSASPAKGEKSEGPKGYNVYTLPNGETDSLPTLDYWIVKLDAAGNKMWDQTIGGAEDDQLLAIEATDDGGYLLGGHSKSNASADKSEDAIGENWYDGDMWVVKIDAEGNIEWDNTIGGSGSESVFDIQPVAGGGYLLVGNSSSPASGDKTEDSEEGQLFWLVWIDEQGNVLKDVNLGRDGARLATVASPADHHYLLGAWIEGDAPEGSRQWDDYYVMKIRDVGELVERPDPTPGYITGGGWLLSPEGAYTPEPLAAGKAFFGFTARNKEGMEEPEGNLVFLLPDARLFFHSRNIDWLSVDGNQAYVEGIGRIGREEGYHFLVSLVDQGQGFRSPQDHFRLIIWDQEENIIYDNQPETSRYAVASEPIERGNLVIHRNKGKSHPVFGSMNKELVSGELLHEFRVYPTQLNKQGLWLEFPPAEKPGQVQVVISDIQGRKMAGKTFNVLEQANRQPWKLDHEVWPSGVYLLKVQGEQLNHQQKLIK